MSPASPKKTASRQKATLPKPPRAAKSKRAVRAQVPSKRVALVAAEAGLDKKATAIQIIDVTGKVDYADYLVLMTGQNNRNVAAIADGVEAALSQIGVRAISIEGLPAAEWVLIDLVDVVVHVFQREARALYDLDGLWMDAERVDVPAQHAVVNRSASET